MVAERKEVVAGAPDRMMVAVRLFGPGGHAIVVLSDSHSVLVKGNTIHDNTGDGLQCAGPLYGYTPGARPADITLEDNDMFTSSLVLGY